MKKGEKVMEKELLGLLMKYWNYEYARNKEMSIKGFYDWLWEREADRQMPTKPDTTRDWIQTQKQIEVEYKGHPTLPDYSKDDLVVTTADIPTPSSDKDRLEKEFKKEFMESLPSWWVARDIWNWILSHAKELGELV